MYLCFISSSSTSTNVRDLVKVVEMNKYGPFPYRAALWYFKKFFADLEINSATKYQTQIKIMG